MKKGSRCIGRTINLSNPRTCVRPNQVQKLVSADATDPCPGPESYWTPRPVPVRICTLREARRTCPPKLCTCPQKPAPRSAAERLRGTLWFLIKGSLVAGLVYWTNSEGVWGCAEETEDLYRRVLATIAPAATYSPDTENGSLGGLRNAKHRMIEHYNRAVLKTMNVIANTPVKLSRQLRARLFPREEGEEEIVTATTTSLSPSGVDRLMERRMQN